MATLKVDLKVGEALTLSGSGSARVTLVAKSGQLARLRIEADDGVSIQRPERQGTRAVVGAGLGREYLAA